MICENIRYAEEEPILLDTLGQHTGLKDKNGNKIFRGDIVYVIPEDENGVVEWDNDTARYIVSTDNTVYDFDYLYGHDLEIIGNVYDNPELLEE